MTQHASPTTSAKDLALRPSPWRQPLKTVALFALLGPVIGYVAEFLPLSFLDGKPEEIGLTLLAMVAFLPVGLMFAFFFGFLPALATGLAVAAADHWLGPGTLGFRVANCFLAGGLMTWLVLAVAGNVEPSQGWMNLTLYGTGALAAAICGWLTRPGERRA